MDWFYGIYKSPNQIYGNFKHKPREFQWDQMERDQYKPLKKCKTFALKTQRDVFKTGPP